MSPLYDVAIAGSGFAGSLLSMIARRLGLSVVLLESARHPRFAIGESSTPLANLFLEELATRYSLPRVAALSKWGTWQDNYPQLPGGLKRGFSFFHHSWGERTDADCVRAKQLLVAASPHDRVADVHWYRAGFDEFLVNTAVAEGVDFLDQTRISTVKETPEWMELEGVRLGTAVRIRARFVIDGTGPRGLLHKTLQIGEAELPGFPPTESLYTHVTGARPFAATDSGLESTPYPVDAAALHHVFDGGWIWVLRFNNGITSAGVAATTKVARRFRFQEGGPAWNRLLKELPSVQEQFSQAQPIRDFTYTSKVAFRSSAIIGPRWALLPSAAGFVDPLLSTGFPLTLLGIKRLANIFETAWGTERFSSLLSSYADQTDCELLAAAQLISSLYANMDDFDRFTDLSLLYFAAASYSETAHRLGRPELASSFLLHDHPTFGPAVRSLLREPQGPGLKTKVREAIDPINVAGLGVERRRNWYPVDAEDLLSATGKLNANRLEINALLDRSGFRTAHA